MSEHGMRRAERAVGDPEQVAAMIRSTNVCRVGFVDGGEPYVLPMSFGWEPDPAPWGRFWFHSATAGRKVGLIAARPRVCVQLETDTRLVTHSRTACAWTLAYRSVMAWGEARAAADRDEASHGLDVLMRHHAGRDGWRYADEMLARTMVWLVAVERLTAKEHRAKESGA